VFVKFKRNGDVQMKKCYTIRIPVKTFWKVFVPLLFFLTAVGGLAGFIAVDRYLMPRVVGVTRDMVSTPDVQGMEYEAGRNKFFGVGLLTEVRGREFDDSIPEGAIISQYPEPETMVKKGRKIAVTVSRGAEAAMIPMIRLMTERQARQELKKAGFNVGDVKKQHHEVHAADVVIDVFPPAGTKISRAMDIDLVLSKGPKPTHAEVPNIIGESLAEARKKIESAGLKVGKIDYQNNSSLVPGTVVSQSAAPGAKVPLDSQVGIVISAIR
jgi:serine/threonine-protein kinase